VKSRISGKDADTVARHALKRLPIRLLAPEGVQEPPDALVASDGPEQERKAPPRHIPQSSCPSPFCWGRSHTLPPCPSSPSPPPLNSDDHLRRSQRAVYSAQVAWAICDRIVEGESLRAICSDAGMPARATVFRWIARHKEFRDRYISARDFQAEGLCEEMIEIARDTNGAAGRPDGAKKIRALRRARGVPVGRGARRPTHADCARPACNVLYQDGLSERHPHSITHNARNYVNWTSGSRGIYKCDWSRRIGLRARHPRDPRPRGSRKSSRHSHCTIRLRLQNELIQTLERYRRGNKQTVEVRHVHIHSGGHRRLVPPRIIGRVS
jgi:hypothetical protein